MCNVIIDEKQRDLPLRRPEGWVPKLPRWTLKLPDDLKELSVAYVGVQQSLAGDRNIHAVKQASGAVEKWLKDTEDSPVIVDRFEVVSGRDIRGAHVWACYWTSKANADQCLTRLQLKDIHASLNLADASAVGLWCERYTPDLTRFETNYSGNDYRPGLAQLKGTEQIEHGLTGYWGAARDRMHASAYDAFDGSAGPGDSPPQPDHPATSSNLHVHGTNERPIAHIRSGQFWENCPADEREAYETKLEPHLRTGLTDIETRPQDLGDYGLRFLRNISTSNSSPHNDNTITDEQPDHQPRRETCAAGFFRSLADLEAWAKSCPSHHLIYNGSVNHRKTFGSKGKMRTWHEICVLKPGEASWEYLACEPNTGTMPFQRCEVL